VFLCKRPFSSADGSAKASERRLDFERDQIDGELKETEELLGAMEREVRHLLAGRTKVSDEIARIQGMLRPVRAAAASVLPPEIAVLDVETGRLEERLHQLQRIKASLDKRETLGQQITQIQQEVAALEAEVRVNSGNIDFLDAAHSAAGWHEYVFESD